MNEAIDEAMDDRLVLVDIFDNPIGETTKAEAHYAGKLHRAFSLFIVHDRRMLIQKRNINKYHSGGLWTNACCSHQRQGEQLEEAVYRRMQEELGCTADFTECFSFVYRHVFENGITEYEYDHVFISDYAGEIAPDPDEAEECKWIGYEELADDLLLNPEKYTVWFQIAAPEVIACTQDRDKR